MGEIDRNGLARQLADLAGFVAEDGLFKQYAAQARAARDFVPSSGSEGASLSDEGIGELALLLNELFYTAGEKDRESKAQEKTDYGLYMDIQTSLAGLNEVLVGVAQEVQASCQADSLRRHYPSMALLGLLYEYGLTVEADPAKAVRYYEAGALKQYGIAQYILATHYYRGREFDKAQYWAGKALDQGLLQSQGRLGKAYYYGSNREDSYDKIVKYLDNEYVAKDEEVTAILGECYFFGRGAAKNYDKVVSLYRDFPHKEKDRVLCYRLGCAYAHSSAYRNLEEGKKWLAQAAAMSYLPAVRELIELTDGQERLDYKYKAASLGDAQAVKDVVDACLHGQLPAADKDALMGWYEDLAKEGDEEVCLHVANLYASGKIVAQDQNRAFLWFKKAAEWGNADAELAVAHRLKYGIGTEANENEAFAWYQKAAVGGNAEAQGVIGKLCYEEGEYELAFGYLAAASAGEDEEAISLLADCYLNGLGTEKDEEKAFSYYQLAASKGSGAAQCKIGIFYEGGADYATALQWYGAAQQNGSLDARLRIALLYYQGYGVPQDVNLAVKEISDLAYDGHAASQLWLGYFYENGVIVDRDYYIASLWYEKAVKAGNKDALLYAKNLEDKLRMRLEREGFMARYTDGTLTKLYKALKVLSGLNLQNKN